MHLFLDLDGTLVDNYLDKSNKQTIQERPHLQDFFNYIFEYFETVSIWTNAHNSWFQQVYSQVLHKYLPANKKFSYILTNNSLDGIARIKDFQYLYQKYTHLFNRHNTLIVDDTPYTYQNNINNAIPIKPFHYMSKNDTELLRIISFFDKYIFSEKTPLFIRKL
jgi:TFIIF-interacting CTD phosphatase-like protein